MKRLFFLFLLMPGILFAQKEEHYLAGAVPEVDGKVVFSKTIKAPSLSQEQLYEAMLSWAGDYYNGEKNRVVYQKPEEGAIACLGNEYIVFSSSALSLDRTTINYLMRIVCVDQRCDLEISGIRYEYNVSYQKQPEKYVAEEWITDKIALRNNKLLRVPGKFRKGTIDLIDKLFVDATNKINGLVSASASAAAPVTAAVVPAVTSQTAVVTPVVPIAPVVAATPLIAATTTAAAQAQPEVLPVQANVPAGYKAVAADKIPGNIIRMMQNDQMMITVSNGQETDFATLSSGGVGYAFSKPVAFCITESGKHIASLIESASSYTLSFYTEAYRDVLDKNKDNRSKDPDRIQNSGLTLITTSNGNKAFSEAWMIIECKKISLSQQNGTAGAPVNGSKILLGEIQNVWIK
ncbi:DUF4468 domain-containing protein [Macellibacteroides fermentans]|uniref:Flavin reductase (DIM6/NTAB) family NADH-FMN oxidoreductase RutF n=2 Tax=Macellibacteroides fermentans TaxID=879969 RepID=A0A8E1ZYH3_9PORP|nr:DUF4468 domain-containing protein [Macellibacteroides fermentans]NYI49932.1 flavin reductase (DIM6/NTAB) family NADH-FMN oxidoreductase RutF [Macellibacteroides fermentans]